jgi:hypothetical protein
MEKKKILQIRRTSLQGQKHQQFEGPYTFCHPIRALYTFGESWDDAIKG